MAKKKPKLLSEMTVDELFVEMDNFMQELAQDKGFSADIFSVIKEIVLRVGPPYEVYEKFTHPDQQIREIQKTAFSDTAGQNYSRGALGIRDENSYYLQS